MAIVYIISNIITCKWKQNKICINVKVAFVVIHYVIIIFEAQMHSIILYANK